MCCCEAYYIPEPLSRRCVDKATYSVIRPPIFHLHRKPVKLTTVFTDMLKAVLFDLDNTSIFFDEVKSANLFFPLIAARFADITPADQFGERLLLATMESHKNDGALTNRQLFLKEFCKGIQQESFIKMVRLFIHG